jgi:hypothetical protein
MGMCTVWARCHLALATPLKHDAQGGLVGWVGADRTVGRGCSRGCLAHAGRRVLGQLSAGQSQQGGSRREASDDRVTGGAMGVCMCMYLHVLHVCVCIRPVFVLYLYVWSRFSVDTPPFHQKASWSCGTGMAGLSAPMGMCPYHFAGIQRP